MEPLKLEKRQKVSMIRETAVVSLEEDQVLEIVRNAISEKFPDFEITKAEIICGMGQGTGYFSCLEVSLLSERQESERPGQKFVQKKKPR